MKVKIFRHLFLISLFLIFSQQCFGSGFAVFTHGASSLGEGLSTVAHGNNPEVVYFNPALMNKLNGTQIENSITFVIPKYEHNSRLLNRLTSTEDALYFPAALYVTHKYSDKLSIGLGIFTPFGLGTEWAPTWEGRYITTKAEMEIFNINPAISYKLSSSVSIAGGIDLLLVDATLENKINFSTLALSDGHQELDGDGSGLGFNLGFHAELGKDFSFGLSYRSEIKTDLDVSLSFQLPSPTLLTSFPNTNGSTTITFPQQLHAAIAYSGFNGLTFEVGVRWEGWSSYDKMDVRLEKAVNGSRTYITPKNWNDTYSLTMGGRYSFNKQVTLLVGYIHGNDPIPDATFEPSIPDSTTDAWTCGFELNLDKYKFGFSYSFQSWDKRNKLNEVGSNSSGGSVIDARANGTYEGESHFISTSFIYKF